jgi:asparagine synthase (glutamine-hydrolysing)
MDECAEAFLEQMRIAVKCRLRSIGPVGAMLSGGLDSSSIVGLISKEYRRELAQPLQTFSLILEDREKCHDWRAIQEMLKDEWLDPEIIPSGIAATQCRTYLEDIRNLNEPFALSQGFTDSLVYAAARDKGCRVVLDGMAGDLLFYNPGASMDCMLRERLFTSLPALLAAYRRHGIDRGPQLLAWSFLRMATPGSLLAAYRKRNSRRQMSGSLNSEIPGDLMNFLHPEIACRFLETKLAKRQGLARGATKLTDQMGHARNFTTGLLSFAHEVNGQIALSNGVEPRSPFSDRRMIEFAVRMPLEAKFSSPWYKYLLRRSMAGVLPDEVRWRRDVGAHPRWSFVDNFVSEMTRCADEIWSESFLDARLRRWIDSAALLVQLRRYRQTKDYVAGNSIFLLAVLAQWLEEKGLDFQILK